MHRWVNQFCIDFAGTAISLTYYLKPCVVKLDHLVEARLSSPKRSCWVPEMCACHFHFSVRTICADNTSVDRTCHSADFSKRGGGGFHLRDNCIPINSTVNSTNFSGAMECARNSSLDLWRRTVWGRTQICLRWFVPDEVLITRPLKEIFSSSVIFPIDK